MGYSKNQKLAKDLITLAPHQGAITRRGSCPQRGLLLGRDLEWQKHPMWQQDPVMAPFRTAANAGPLLRVSPGPPNAKATEVYSKYIIVDMYAKAVQGMKADDAVKWADGELKKIYG